jgi:hypothetical protein
MREANHKLSSRFQVVTCYNNDTVLGHSYTFFGLSRPYSVETEQNVNISKRK